MAASRKKEIGVEEALTRCASLCARAEHSESELRKKMQLWGLAADGAGEVIRRLRDMGFIDDGRFARAFVNDKYRFDGWGRVKIRYSLRLHGIGDVIIDEAMEEIDEKEYQGMLQRLLEAKNRTLAGKDPYKRKASLMRYAASRGFCLSEAMPVVNRLVAGADDFDASCSDEHE